MVSKYAPYTINAKRRYQKYKKRDNTRLTEDQIRELMGCFEKARNKMEVRNLVPYELWKGDQAEPEDMDVGQHDSVFVNFQGEHMEGSKQGFVAMGYFETPKSEIDLFDEAPPMNLLLEPHDVWREETWNSMEEEL